MRAPSGGTRPRPGCTTPTLQLQGCGGGAEGIDRSSLDARKPQHPTNSEEYQVYLQGVLYSTRGAQKSKTRVLPTL
eukprot:394827-Pyramimonas_sp.AAC.1